MWIKYIITDNEFTIGVKIDPVKGKVILGGSLRFFTKMDIVKEEYFKIKKSKATYPNHNKVRYSFPYTLEKFKLVIKKLEKDDLIVQEVYTHGRIFR